MCNDMAPTDEKRGSGEEAQSDTTASQDITDIGSSKELSNARLKYVGWRITKLRSNKLQGRHHSSSSSLSRIASLPAR